MDAEPGVWTGEHAGAMSPPPAPPGEDRDIFGRTPRTRPDWSHRRGEPRVFALGWTLYLMLCTVLMFGTIAMHPRSLGGELYRPAARTLVVLIAVGIAVLWPMVRLSQAAPERRTPAHVLADVLVLLIPAQALLWPQRVLAGWPLEVIAGQSALLGAWALLIGGVLAGALSLARTGPDARGGVGAGQMAVRAGAMLGVVALVSVGPLLAMREGPARSPETTLPGWSLSPVLGVYELGRDRLASGQPAEMLPEHWRGIAATAFAGCGVFLWGALVSVLAPRRDGFLAAGEVKA